LLDSFGYVKELYDVWLF